MFPKLIFPNLTNDTKAATMAITPIIVWKIPKTDNPILIFFECLFFLTECLY